MQTADFCSVLLTKNTVGDDMPAICLHIEVPRNIVKIPVNDCKEDILSY